MTALDRTSFLANGAGFTPRAVEVPEMGGTVYVRPVPIEAIVRLSKAGAASYLLLIDALCDEKGNRLLTAEDGDALGQMPAGVIARLITQAEEASGMTGDAARTAAGK